jgi:glycosyltransferase involved in cell wall biosynthesis
MIRIVHISTGKQCRGGERQVLFLHQGLHRHPVIESILFYQPDSVLSGMVKQTGFPLPVTGVADISGFIGFLRQLKKINPDFIHCHDSTGFTYGSIAGYFLKIKTVYTRRAVFPIGSTWFNRWKFSRCTRIVAISSAVARICREIVPQMEVSIIHDGVTFDAPRYSREESRAILKLAPDQTAIGTVGYFTGEKNMPLIFDLATALAESFPSACIVCIGQLTEESLKKARNFSNIRLTGIMENAVDYYNAFDMYISPSTREGLGTALLDAMVRDIPVAALDSGGSKDIFPDQCPVHIEQEKPAEFIKAVKNSITNYQKACAEARELGKSVRERFGVNIMVDRYAALYQNLW